MSPCSLVDRDQHYGEISSFHFKGIKVLYSEDGGNIFLRSVGTFLPNYTAAKYRRQCAVCRLLRLLVKGLSFYSKDNLFYDEAPMILSIRTLNKIRVKCPNCNLKLFCWPLPIV